MPARITSSQAAAGDRIITSLEQALAAPTTSSLSNSDLLSSVLSSLHRHARLFGFASKQCDHLVQLALRGRLVSSSASGPSVLKRKAPKTSASLSILRCIVPAPRAKIGREAVLDILACLGPSPGTDVAKQAGMPMEVDTDEGSSLGPPRLKVDSKVQAAALKLLCVLFESPSLPLSMAADLYTDEESQIERAAHYSAVVGNLPSTYLSTAARTVLDKSYAILFHYIDYQTIRPHLCYLLCRLTKRRHVRHYRITKLVALRASSAPETGLSALLSMFANFYPDLLFPELLGGAGSTGAVMGTGAVAGLKYPDSAWLARVLHTHARVARRNAGQTVESDEEQEDDSTAAGSGGRARGRPAKKAKLEAGQGDADGSSATVAATAASIAIPNLVTIQPLNSAQKAFGTSPSLVTEFSSLRHLAHSLDRLVLPSQVAAMLGSSFGARMMRIAVLAGATITNEDSLSQSVTRGKRDREAEQDLCWSRLSDWLESVLADELGALHGRASTSLKVPSNQASFNRLSGLLRRARQVFELADQMPARFERLLSAIFASLASVATDTRSSATKQETSAQLAVQDPEWTAKHDQLTLEALKFVSLIKPAEFDELDSAFLEPLQKIAFSSKVDLATSAKIIESLCAMLGNWGVREWLKIGKQLDSKTNHRWGITYMDPNVDYTSTIASTAERVHDLASKLLGQFPNTVALEHATLTLYEVLFTTLAGLHGITQLSPAPFYAFSLHSGSIMPLSRLCGLVQDLRSVFEQFDIDPLPKPHLEDGLENDVAQARAEFCAESNLAGLNSNVTLLANLIWMGKLVRGPNVPGCLMPGLSDGALDELTDRADLLNQKLSTIALTSQSVALANLSERFANLFCQSRSGGNGKSGGTQEEDWIRGPIGAKTLKSAKKSGIPANWTHTDFRAHFLDWLDRQGASGIYRLLQAILVSVGNQLTQIRSSQPTTTAMTS
ncbi:hypothetical protein BCV70DRAFT_36486 [Testicularia cyperi]|uniref:Mis6-domain-containing protein n=1 Tax=Testicularia cyperi TaxID=1882483 RepID=A0A317XIZ3_9BASI|nr:hypothetical protein BCV70DRAFT_36486 [Testicularia cyperi]